jgi:hypothetical protein
MSFTWLCITANAGQKKKKDPTDVEHNDEDESRNAL